MHWKSGIYLLKFNMIKQFCIVLNIKRTEVNTFWCIQFTMEPRWYECCIKEKYCEEPVDFLKCSPRSRNKLFESFWAIEITELKSSLALFLLGAHIRCRSVGKFFSLDSHLTFSATVSGRRFGQLLRCPNCSSEIDNHGLRNEKTSLDLF